MLLWLVNFSNNLYLVEVGGKCWSGFAEGHEGVVVHFGVVLHFGVLAWMMDELDNWNGKNPKC
jgi:hypothetical protein